MSHLLFWFLWQQVETCPFYMNMYLKFISCCFCSYIYTERTGRSWQIWTIFCKIQVRLSIAIIFAFCTCFSLILIKYKLKKTRYISSALIYKLVAYSRTHQCKGWTHFLILNVQHACSHWYIRYGDGERRAFTNTTRLTSVASWAETKTIFPISWSLYSLFLWYQVRVWKWLHFSGTISKQNNSNNWNRNIISVLWPLRGKSKREENWTADNLVPISWQSLWAYRATER